MDISASTRDCALALSYLNLPALAHLSVAAHDDDDLEVLGLLPYVTLHAHGPQDIRPLQSVLILHTSDTRLEMLAWTVPNIDFDARDSSFIFDMLKARVSLSITVKWTTNSNINTRTFDAVLAALPLDSLVTLTAPDRIQIDKQVWLNHAHRWRQLRCVRLGTLSAQHFRDILLEDSGKNECSLFPSLTKLVIVDTISSISTRRLMRAVCEILIMRVDQGVPLRGVDMRACNVPDRGALQELSKLGVDVGDPTDERSETQKQSFTAYYSGLRDLLAQDNSDLDSDVDEDGDDGSEESICSDMDMVVDESTYIWQTTRGLMTNDTL